MKWLPLAMTVAVVVATFALNSRIPIPVGLGLLAAGAVFIPGVLLGVFAPMPQGDVYDRTKIGMRAWKVFLVAAPLVMGFFTAGFLSGWLPLDPVDDAAFGTVSFVVGALATARITYRIRELRRKAGGKGGRSRDDANRR